MKTCNLKNPLTLEIIDTILEKLYLGSQTAANVSIYNDAIKHYQNLKLTISGGISV